MKTRYGISILAITGFFLFSGFTGNINSIVSAHRARMKKQMTKIHDSVAVYKIYGEDRNKPPATKTLYRKADRFRLDIIIPGEKDGKEIRQIFVSDGKKIWMLTPLGKVKIGKAEAGQATSELETKGYLSNKGKIVGTETINRIKCKKIDMSADPDSPYKTAWVAVDDYRLIRMEGKEKSASKRIVVTWSNYKTTSGIKLPWKMVTRRGNKTISRIVTQSMKINKGLSDDTFDPDKIKFKKINVKKEAAKRFKKQWKKNLKKGLKFH